MGDVILLTGYLLAVAGVLVLRLSWGLAGRSRMLNAAGWAALAAAVLCGAVAAGAWGITVVSLWATATAFVLLAVAGWTAQPSVRRAARIVLPM